MRPSVWYTADIFQVFAGFLTVLYLASAVALGAALLYYTFTPDPTVAAATELKLN